MKNGWRLFSAVIAAGCVCFAAKAVEWSGEVALSGDVSEAVTLTGDTTVTVASGTKTVSGVISGGYRITKQGAGTLRLAAANDFTGGLQIDAGVVDVAHVDGLGDKSSAVSITIINDTVCQLKFSAAGEYDNPISFIGSADVTDKPNKYEAVMFATSGVVLNGKITTSRSTPWFADADADCVTTFNGEIAFSGKNIAFAPNGTFKVYSKITCGTLQAQRNDGVIELYTKPTVTTLSFISAKVKPMAANLLDGITTIWWTTSGNTTTTGQKNKRGGLVLTEDQSITRFQFNTTPVNDDDSTHWAVSSTKPVTLTETVGSAITTETSEPRKFSPSIALTGDISYVLDLAQNVTTYGQGFSNRVHTMTGTLTANAGYLLLKGNIKFTNVPELIVGQKGILEIKANRNEVVFPSVTNIIIASGGKLKFAEENSSTPFTNNGWTLNLATGSSVELPERLELRPLSVTIDGEPVEDGTYGAGALNGILSGGGTIVVPKQGAVGESDTWVGGAATSAATEPANWSKHKSHDLTSGLFSPTFAAGGAEATFDCAAVFDKMTLSPAADGAAFALRGADDEASLSVLNDFILDWGGKTASWTFDLPVTLGSAQSWHVPTGSEIVFNDDVTASLGLVTADGVGAGCVKFLGATNTFGNLTLTNAVFGGVIRNPDGSISTEPVTTSNRKKDSVISLYCANDTTSDRFFLTNAVIEKAIVIGQNDCKAGAHGLTTYANTTNIIKGYAYLYTPWMNHVVNAGSQLIFEGGGYGAWTHKFSGGGRAIIRNKPMTVWSSTPTIGLVALNATVELAVKGNCFLGLKTENGNAKIVFSVDGAVTNTVFEMSSDNAATWDFANTKQEVRYAITRSSGIYTGEEGSELMVLEAPANPAGNTNFSCKVEGKLSLAMGGAGRLLLKGQAFNSSGSLTVTNGVLELQNGATWRNGTDFYAKGAGTLAFGAAGQVNENTAKLHFADDGRVSIPANTTLTVKYAVIDGSDGSETLVTAGDYTAGATGLLAGRITGAGTLRVLASCYPYAETTTDRTAQGDWDIRVDEGCTNVVTVAQTGSGRIVKTGKGALIFRAAGSFTGGIELREGDLVAEVANAFGTGDIAVLGQRDDYAGPCRIVLVGAGKEKDKTVILPNAVHFIGQTSSTYPGIYTYGHGSVLAGPITADQDLVFTEDREFLGVEWPAHYYDMYSYATGLTFSNTVSAVGSVAGDGWSRFVFAGEVTAAKLDLPHFRTDGSNQNAAFDFRAACDVAEVANTRHTVTLYADGCFEGAALVWDLSTAAYGSIVLNGHDLTVASLDGNDQPLSTANTTWALNSNNRQSTVTLTGSGEHRASIALSGSSFDFIVDGADDFVQTLHNRTNTISGSVQVKKGALKVTGAAYFPNLTVLKVDDVFEAEGQPFADNKLDLTLGAEASFAIKETAVLRVPTLTVGGVKKDDGIYTPASLAQLKSGRLYVGGFEPQPQDDFIVNEDTTVDTPWEVLGDQRWIIAGGKTLTVDNALKCSLGKITVVSPFYANADKANRAWLVFKGENTIDGALVVTAADMKVSGVLATPGHVDQGTAAKNGANTLTFASGASAQMHLSNATIEKPMYFSGSGDSVIYSEQGTTNLITGHVGLGSAWQGFRVYKDSELTFAGGLTTSITLRNYGADLASRLRLTAPISITGVGWDIDSGTLSLEHAGNKFLYLWVGFTNDKDAQLDLPVSYAFDTSNGYGVLLAGYYYLNTPPEFAVYKSTGKRLINLFDTVQQVSVLMATDDATITGDGARLEIMNQGKTDPKLPAALRYVAAAIEGDVTLAMCGSGELLLTNQTFASTGALVATNGTIRLAADAVWTGNDIQIGGTGRLAVEKAGAISPTAFVSFSEDGALDIPSGVTLAVKGVRVRKNGGWLTVTSGSSPTLAGHLTGGGTLTIEGSANLRRMPLEWNTTYAADIPYEVEIDTNKIGSVGTGFAVYATVGGEEEQLPVSVMEGSRPARLALRFTVPAGTTALACEAGAGALQIDDSAALDNILAGAVQAGAKWTVPSSIVRENRADGILFSGTGYSSAYVDYVVKVPAEWRGRSVRFEMDSTSKAKMVWAGYVRLWQYSDESAATQLPESVVDARWESHFRPPEKFVRYRENGRIHPEAKSVKLRIELRGVNAAFDDYGLPIGDRTDDSKAKLLVSHLALRLGEELPFPKFDDAFFTAGASGESGDTALVLGGEKSTAFFYATRGQAAWADNTQLRNESQIFFPSGSGTVEAWFKPSGWVEPTKETFFFDASSSSNLSNSQPDRGMIFAVGYTPNTGKLRMYFKDMANKVFETTATGVDIALNEWSHIAASWEVGGAARLFVNGAQVATVSLVDFKKLDLATAAYPNEQHAPEFYFGSHVKAARDLSAMTRADYPLFTGAADLLRVSTGARYTAAFTPATSFEVDGSTRALFTFDRTYNGVSGGGDRFIRGSLRALTDRVDHKLSIGGETLQYYAAEIKDDNDHTKVLDICNYPDLPQTEDFLAARSEHKWRGDVTPNQPFGVTAEDGAIADYIEFRNIGTEPLRYPILLREGDVDPRSFGDLKDTMGLENMSDKDRANTIFQYVLNASDYFMNHTAYFAPNSNEPGDVEYQAITMLNGYCGFECGPLNNMTANLFANVGGMPASQTAGYGHSFEQVFYDGKNHLYDLSAQKFIPAMDNETAGYLLELADQPGAFHRIGASPDHFIRKSTRGPQANTPEYREKVAFVLNPGEFFRAWYDNNGEVNDLQCAKSQVDQPTDLPKRDYTEACGAVVGSQGRIWRINRFFPHYGNGFVVFDGRPTADNPAFTVSANSFVYQVKSCYPIVAADYSATLVNGGKATLKLSTDGGSIWRPLTEGHLRYPVRARNQYLIRVEASIDEVANFHASTEVQLNVRIFPGRVRAGENSYVLKAENNVPARVTIGYRVPVKSIEIAGGVYSGTIRGNERQLVVVDPTEDALKLGVTGASATAKVSATAGLTATLADGQLTITATDQTMKGFGQVVISDGGAKKELTVLVAKDARLVSAANASVSGGASVVPAGVDSVQPCVNFTANDGSATLNFAAIPAGSYAVMVLDRFMTGSPSYQSNHLQLTFAGVSGNCGCEANSSVNFYKARYGREGRSNFKWDYPVSPNFSYYTNMMRIFAAAGEQSSLTVKCTNAETEPIELAAVLIVPIDGDDNNTFGSSAEEDLYCDLVKVLGGLNTRPWAVTDGVDQKRGMMLILR